MIDVLTPQPAPTGDGEPIWPIVIRDAEDRARATHSRTIAAEWDLLARDMRARDAQGRERYGVPLCSHNGRDALVDAYQESLDLCAYLRQDLQTAPSDAPDTGGVRIAYAEAMTLARVLRQALSMRGHS